MGYYADRSKGKGQLYLITRDEEPFCAHQYFVKIETSSSFIPIKSYGKIQITLIGESFLNETFMMTRKEDEEMTLGDSIARILVPHPILSQPTRIEILYTAYSGWLSSGLTQWRLDKVTLMDSFGKSSSVCKKNLILESGVPVTLPLYPGNCNLPKDTYEFEAEDRLQDDDNDKSFGFNETENSTKFTPTQVVKVGLNDEKDKKEKSGLSLKDAIDIFDIPWRNDKENSVIDNEAESSRAFNTRIVKASSSDKADADGLVREIVEPILKPHSSKNARSHDLDKEKSEITEPILGPTTAKSKDKTKSTHKGIKTNKENSVYDSNQSPEWVPKDIPITERSQGKWKREDESRVITGFNTPVNDNPLESIATTVQFLPQRLARMFEQAEKYARDTILPLVSTYTPKFISDFIAPKDNQPKYVPLNFEESTTKAEVTSVASRANEARNMISIRFDPPNTTEAERKKVTTPYTHIQRIIKKEEQKEEQKKEEVSTSKPELSTQKTSVQPTHKEVSRKTRDDMHVAIPGSKVSQTASLKADASTKAQAIAKAIYVDLPVFDNSEKRSKYIPLA